MTIPELIAEVYADSVDHGWHEKERSPLEYHMLIVTEIAEATECVRNHEGGSYINEDGKPCGELIELADTIIRICDYVASKGWNLEEALRTKIDFNKTREWKHGGKRY